MVRNSFQYKLVLAGYGIFSSAFNYFIGQHGNRYPIAWDKIDSSHNNIDDDGDGLIDEVGEKDSVLRLLRRRNTEATLFLTGKVNFYTDLKL